MYTCPISSKRVWVRVRVRVRNRTCVHVVRRDGITRDGYNPSRLRYPRNNLATRLLPMEPTLTEAMSSRPQPGVEGVLRECCQSWTRLSSPIRWVCTSCFSVKRFFARRALFQWTAACASTTTSRQLTHSTHTTSNWALPSRPAGHCDITCQAIFSFKRSQAPAAHCKSSLRTRAKRGLWIKWALDFWTRDTVPWIAWTV